MNIQTAVAESKTFVELQFCSEKKFELKKPVLILPQN